MSAYLKREILLLIFVSALSFAYNDESSDKYDDENVESTALVFENEKFENKSVQSESNPDEGHPDDEDELEVRSMPGIVSTQSGNAKISIKKFSSDNFDDNEVPEWNMNGNNADPFSNLPGGDKHSKVYHDAMAIIKKLQPLVDNAPVTAMEPAANSKWPGNAFNQMPNLNGFPSDPMTAGVPNPWSAPPPGVPNPWSPTPPVVHNPWSPSVTPPKSNPSIDSARDIHSWTYDLSNDDPFSSPNSGGSKVKKITYTKISDRSEESGGPSNQNQQHNGLNMNSSRKRNGNGRNRVRRPSQGQNYPGFLNLNRILGKR